MPKITIWVLLGVALFASCTRHAYFETVPGQPYYLLRDPSRRTTSYPDVLAKAGDPKQAWVDLSKGMSIAIEHAILRDPNAPLAAANFIGAESISFGVANGGQLTRTSLKTLPNRPANEASIESVVTEQLQNQPFHRLFFQVALDRAVGTVPAVLLSAKSRAELDRQTQQLATNNRSNCRDCVIFSPQLAVSLFAEVIVNGEAKQFAWGTFVAGVVGGRSEFQMLRTYGGRQIPVRVDTKDREALRLPIMPGDRFTW